MTYYTTLASQLQSRIKRRGNHIAAVECWKKAYHSMNQLKKFRETKEELTKLRADQMLDKDLLKLTHAAIRDELDAKIFWAGAY